jgi:tripartite-type tricarboxylate transporter receptor subunit TctC
VGGLNAQTANALQAANVRETLAWLGFAIQSSTPQQFYALLKSETEQ